MKDALRLYIPNSKRGETFALNQSQQKHVRVLRMNDGDMCEVFDGQGNLFAAHLKTDKKTSSIVIDEHVLFQEQETLLTVAIAPTKNMARFEWFVEKATEIGIAAIIPIKSDHSERLNLNANRVERVVESAASQSKELWVPSIHNLESMDKILDLKFDHKWLAHCNEGMARTSLEEAMPKPGHHLILIGPEGDFSEREISQAEEKGFQSISLGTKRLRTETAALTAVLAYSIFNS